ncbi:MAG: EAL domain-containing protein [Chloroflexota bacterium]
MAIRSLFSDVGLPVLASEPRLGALAGGNWVTAARFRRSERGLAETSALLDTLQTEAPVGFGFVDRDFRVVHMNETLAEINGSPMAQQLGRLVKDIVPEIWPLVEPMYRVVLETGHPVVNVEIVARTAADPTQRHHWHASYYPVRVADAIIGIALMTVDITDRVELREAESERGRLAAVVEHVADSVMIADLEARITYVNPAFERLTGYTREEVIGQNPRILGSGVQAPAFYTAMWAALTSGSPWVADFVNRRKDGSLFTEEAVISPIRDGTGAVTSYVAVKRDVTSERAIQTSSVRLARERALIAGTIRAIGPRDTPEATAQAICGQVLNLSGLAAAQLFVFGLNGRAVPIGFAVAHQPDPQLRPLPLGRSRYLRERATDGPWIEPWVDRPGHPYNKLLLRLGVHQAAFAPVRWDGRLIGLLVVDAASSVGEAAVAAALGALVEFADLAGALIGRDLDKRAEAQAVRQHLHAIIARQRFHPVFQPIIDLETGAAVGYEALTRFHDGVAPDVRFGEAATVGLGQELETATIKAALAEARLLPKGAWLNLNASPTLIMAGQPLASLLRGTRRPLVLEVTEHAEIGDYAAFGAALRALRPRVELAVDDAGAGFASLRHILELRPSFVKLDRSLVAGLEADPARQALIVGLLHFARSTNSRLIAEGIETVAERDTLRALDIHLGQGYLLGRPGPAADV